MATPDEIESRLSAVERDVSELRRETTHGAADAAAARVLSAGADRDVSEVRAELRAHTGALNALRETQIEMGHQIERVENRLSGVEQTMTTGFATLGTGMTQILTLLESSTEE